MPELKCSVISDTHGLHSQLKLKGGDVLFHCGDYSSLGQVSETMSFMSWLSRQPYTHKVLIAGNHDWGFEPLTEGLVKRAAFHFRGRDLVLRGLDQQYRDLADSMDITYLHNEMIEINGFKIYGSPYQKMIDRWNIWAFNYDSEDDYSWDHIPFEADVVLTHCPPYGILDNNYNFTRRYGSLKLTERIDLIKPLYHLFGHIHEGYGRLKKDGVTYINAASLNREYRCVNKPKNFTLKRGVK